MESIRIRLEGDLLLVVLDELEGSPALHFPVGEGVERPVFVLDDEDDFSVDWIFEPPHDFEVFLLELFLLPRDALLLLYFTIALEINDLDDFPWSLPVFLCLPGTTFLSFDQLVIPLDRLRNRIYFSGFVHFFLRVYQVEAALVYDRRAVPDFFEELLEQIVVILMEVVLFAGVHSKRVY